MNGHGMPHTLLIDREGLVSSITAFCPEMTRACLDGLRSALEREIDAAGPSALADSR
jgi:hypothetical protein